MTTFTIISAIICLIIAFLIIRNLYEPTYIGYSGKVEEYNKVKFPLYFYIFAIIICILPIINIIGIIVLISWCICKCIEDDWIIKGPIGKICEFLNRPL